MSESGFQVNIGPNIWYATTRALLCRLDKGCSTHNIKAFRHTPGEH